MHYQISHPLLVFRHGIVLCNVRNKWWASKSLDYNNKAKKKREKNDENLRAYHQSSEKSN
jgi:hypothetical protein